MMNNDCVICGKKLVGRQQLYCGSVCREKVKGWKRKEKRDGLIREMLRERGGYCSVCGYDRIEGLCFKHPTISRTEITLMLYRKIDLGIIDECSIVCKGCI